MLSRVADALFWMSRYLERAEQVARLLDVCFHLELDLHGVLGGPIELQWTSLAAVLQQRLPVSNEGLQAPGAALSVWLTFATENPSSIVSCVSRARANARGVRGAINSEMWRELNKLYWRLQDAEFAARAQESPHDFYEAVEVGASLFHGICDATLSHDEGWQFIQLGKMLERAERTLRVLDVHYHLIQDLGDPADLPLANLRWGAVLRSCRAYEAYQRRHVGRIEPMQVVEFLLLDVGFPRSVRFCLEAAAAALAAIEGGAPGRALSKVERVLGLVLSELRFRDLEQILRGELHGFLTHAIDQCALVGRAVQNRYSLH
jgi:uncharacterized alpha-E superfamily protein